MATIKYKNHGQPGVVHVRSEVQAGRMTKEEAEKASNPAPITNKQPAAAPSQIQATPAPAPATTNGGGKK